MQINWLYKNKFNARFISQTDMKMYNFNDIELFFKCKHFYYDSCCLRQVT